jgi:O-antigen/teichoic acid export membrane protein
MTASVATRRTGSRLLTASRIVTFGFTALATIVFARALSPLEFGVLAGALAVNAVVGLFGTFGIDQLYLRGELDDDELRSRALELAAIALGANLVAALAWPGLPAMARACIVVLGFVGAGEQLKLPWFYGPTRLLDFATRARRELTAKAATTLLSVAAALVIGTAVAAAIGSLVGSIAVLVVAGRWLAEVRPKALRFVRLHYRQGLPYALSGALYTVYFQVDMAMMASFRPTVDVADYRVAFSFMLAAIVVPVAMNNDVLRTRLYRLRSAIPFSAAGYHDVERRALAMTAALGVACGVILFAAADPLVGLVYGSGYDAAIGLVQILAIACLPHFLNSWSGNVLVARGRTRAVVIVQAALLATNVAVNLWAIPTHGPEGAAVVTLGTEALGLLLYGAVLLNAPAPVRAEV